MLPMHSVLFLTALYVPLISSLPVEKDEPSHTVGRPRKEHATDGGEDVAQDVCLAAWHNCGQMGWQNGVAIRQCTVRRWACMRRNNTIGAHSPRQRSRHRRARHRPTRHRPAWHCLPAFAVLPNALAARIEKSLFKCCAPMFDVHARNLVRLAIPDSWQATPLWAPQPARQARSCSTQVPDRLRSLG